MMKHSPDRSSARRRRGFTITELIVAASLLVAVMAVVAPLTVRSGRLWQESRRQQLVIEELSNQLEWLIHLSPAQRASALTNLTVPEYLQKAIPGAKLSAESIRDEHGTRLVLSLAYGAQAMPAPRPVTLVGWLDPLPAETKSQEILP